MRAWRRDSALADRGLISHLYGGGWLRKATAMSTLFFESQARSQAYLTVPLVKSADGSTTWPFSTTFDTLNTARDSTTAMKTDVSASCRPGQILMT